MRKKVKLKDGGEAVIRPMRRDDLERSYDFFKALPEEDRMFLRTEVTSRELARARIRRMNTGRVKRIVAIAEGAIIADGVLEMEERSWKQHVGELRLIVARNYQRKGLGMLMARELYALAASERVEEIVVKMMRPQKAARNIFKKLGFQRGITLPGYVKDLTGARQDLIVMRCDLNELWKKLEDRLADTDWQRTR